MLIDKDWFCNFWQITKLFSRQKGNCKLLGKPKLDFKSSPSAFSFPNYVPLSRNAIFLLPTFFP